MFVNFKFIKDFRIFSQISSVNGKIIAERFSKVNAATRDGQNIFLLTNCAAETGGNISGILSPASHQF